MRLLPLDSKLGELLAVQISEAKTVRGVDDQIEYRAAQADAARLARKTPITFFRRRDFLERSSRFDERKRLRRRGK
jgi:hypothetical protein